MNRQIVKLFGFIVVLFAILVGFTSYWSVFDAKALKEKEANKRPLLEQQQIRRGRILAADGTVIAHSVAKGQRRPRCATSAATRKARSSATRSATASSSQGDSEFEQFHNDQLVGEESEFGSILDQLRGHEAGRQRHRHQPRPGGAAGRAQRPRSSRLRRRGRDRTEHRPGQGDGLEHALRPEPGSLRTRKAERERSRSRRCSTAPPRAATRRARPSRW